MKIVRRMPFVRFLQALALGSLAFSQHGYADDAARIKTLQKMISAEMAKQRKLDGDIAKLREQLGTPIAKQPTIMQAALNSVESARQEFETKATREEGNQVKILLKELQVSQQQLEDAIATVVTNVEADFLSTLSTLRDLNADSANMLKDVAGKIAAVCAMTSAWSVRQAFDFSFCKEKGL